MVLQDLYIGMLFMDHSPGISMSSVSGGSNPLELFQFHLGFLATRVKACPLQDAKAENLSL